jgi:hypothetical protein
MFLSTEQIITISILLLWFTFPIGVFIAIMRQQNDEIRKPKIIEGSNRIEDYQFHDAYYEDSNHEHEIEENIENDDAEINVPHHLANKKDIHTSHTNI